MKTVDYLLSALKHRHKQGRADGFLTDQPVGIKLAKDAVSNSKNSLKIIFINDIILHAIMQ